MWISSSTDAPTVRSRRRSEVGRAPPTLVVDARGHRCPTPTLRLRRALERAAPGGLVELIADDPLARIDVPHFVREAGYRIVSEAHSDLELRFLIGPNAR
jgi:tRNA 2-thiouridine synthesizing protein A